MSLRVRLALLQAAVLAVSLGLLGFALVEAIEQALLADVDEALLSRASQLAEELASLAATDVSEAEAARLHLDANSLQEFVSPGLFAQVVSPDGRVLRSSRNLPPDSIPILPRALADVRLGRTVIDTIPVAGAERVRVASVPVSSDGRLLAIVRVGQSLHQVDVVLRGLVRLLVAGGGISLLGALAATWILVSRSLRPLERIAATAEQIAATGDVTLQVAESPTREIARLAASFNRMIERLRRLLESQQQLLADTSHELRNPLTVIRTNLGLLARDLDPATRLEVVAETEAEAERMSRLVGDLLFLGSLEGASRGEQAPVRLDQIVLNVVDRFRQIAPGHRIDAVTENVVVRGDADRLRQLVANLVDNAVRYTPEGGTVDVSLRRIGPEAELVVRDSGIGIEPHHLPRIFDRFYRVDPARGRDTGGTGLGLAIVKHVAEAHGGRVRAESTPGQGSRFIVDLPAEPSWSVSSPEASTTAPSEREADSPPAASRSTTDHPARRP